MATPRDILIAPGVGNYVITCNNSTDAVKPGHILTMTGETADTNNVAWPDAADDMSIGVAGCAPGHDIDTAYSVGDMLPVYVVGSGVEVWVRVKTSAGAIKRGVLLKHDGATAVNGLAILGTEGVYENLGRTTMDSPDLASERWCKVRLTGG